MTIRHRAIRACVFDAYGTLFDVASAALRCADALGDSASALASLWRDKQLQYTWLRTVQGRHADFWQVTGDALAYAMETFQVPDADLHHRLMNMYLHLDAFPEVPGVLRRVKEMGLPTAILSNGTPAMLAAAVKHAGIGGHIDLVISVEEVGVYKPHVKVYQRAADRLRLAPGQICFLSANAWDAHAAAAFGMQVIWCNRHGHRAEYLPGAPDALIRDLGQLPALLTSG